MAVERIPEAGRLEVPAGLRAKPSAWANAVNFVQQKPLGAFGAAVMILVILLAIFAPLIAPHDPEKIGAVKKFSGPGVDAVLGGDELGRDVLSRIIFGSRVALQIGLTSVVVGISLGMVIGIFSAYIGGKTDLVVQRLVDALMAFPPIILALGLMAALGASKLNVFIALVAILVPGAARVVRSQALSIKELDYTLAARAIGANSTRIMLRHIMPNVMATYIVLITITLGFAIIIEAALSFLGVGVPPDVATWGGMMSAGRRHIETSIWLPLFPGIAIAIVVFAVNFLGDALRDVLDPKLRGRM